MTIRVDILGLPVDLVIHDPRHIGIEEALRVSWNRCLRTEGVDAVLTVWCSLDQDAADPPAASPTLSLITAPDVSILRSTVTSHLTLMGIEDLAGTSFLFHATASSHPVTGDVIALVGPSGRGKTTAAQAMARHRGYVTDETVAVLPDGSVLGYPKPLSVKAHALDTIKTQVGPDELGLVAPTPGVPLSLARLVLLSRDPECVTPVVERVPLASAIVELSTEMSYLWKYPAPLYSLARLIERTGGVHRVRYAEAATLPDLLSNPPAAEGNESWSSAEISGAGELTPETAPVSAGLQYRARPTTDALEIDGNILILVENQVVLLSPVGSLIWSATREWTHSDTVHRTLIESFGPHPDSAILAERALHDLADQGVLEQRLIGTGPGPKDPSPGDPQPSSEHPEK
ncbi:hypothetical protein GCM10022198_22750 [Klugiella xanthotipulae]|uniref:Coenzyme PQQ synthesis protein D (PqqD) n=1 Tax=Klugiella xanthotipulae TaxID=244735 RepID=A0A543HY90_9MICO|nr:hypothetical protein [Klugiella xanthotipulae]TQM63326.1 hypothetical protein FB466_1586 [Klugiella xanthotipulae]